MKKTVFFPYHPDLKTLVDHKDALRNYQIAGFISYEEDKSLIHQLNQSIGLENVPDDQLLHGSDAVILLDNYRDYKTDKYYQVIEDAVSRGIEIYITPLTQTQLDLKRYQGLYQILELLPNDMDTIEKEYRCRREIKVYDIATPVIGVIGQGKNCDKFENQLLLKEVLELEYETITVTTNALGVLFGCYTIPSFLYEDLPFQEKVVKFNYYIRKISKLANLDVIVLGIPEGITPFERYEFHHFAEYPLIVTSAVSIDMAILCIYFAGGSIYEDGLKMLVDSIQDKFNVPVDAIAISRTAFEVPVEEHEKIVFEYLDKPYLCKHYPRLDHINLPMINMLKQEEAIDTIKRCLRRLEENIRAI